MIALLRRHPWWLIVGSYALFTWWMYHQWGWWPTHAIVAVDGYDQAQQVWFLEWPAYALTHGHNPFVSSWMNYPHGVNLFANTSMPLLGLLATPLTLLGGPLVTYAWLLRLGLVLSACSASFTLRRLGAGWPAVWLGGLLYGFNASRLTVGYFWVHLTFDVFTPLIALAVVRLAQGRWSTRRAGVILGLLLAAKACVAMEMTFVTVVTLLVALTLFVARSYRDRALVLRVVHGTAIGFAVMFTALLVPLYYYFFGPQHLNGPQWADPTKYGNWFLGDFIHPPSQMLLAHHHQASDFWLSPYYIPWGNLTYVGVATLALVALALWWGRREPVVQVLGVTGFLVFVLSIGPFHFFPGTQWIIHLPYWWLRHVPIFSSSMPIRFGQMVYLVTTALAAWALHVGLTRGRNVKVLVAVLAVVAVSMNLPRESYHVVPLQGSTWLRTNHQIAEGSVVLTYPYPLGMSGQLTDQAMSGMRYKLIGGWAFVPRHPYRRQNLTVQPLGPPAVFQLFCRGLVGHDYAVCPGYDGPPVAQYPSLATATTALHRFVVAHHVDYVVWRNEGVEPFVVRRYLSAAFGAGHVVDGGLVTWWRVSERSVSNR